ncbi:DUF429 domain-containing protein [archaeon]|nr:DUF429 domain-containing protein [archaeon]MBL7057533.1 DUF429 domain-containing protein [Candidatus Woesearchaeota archaeon]
MKIIGLDLAGNEERITGFCLLTEEIEDICELKTNEEIIKKVDDMKPDVVVIDAPLSFPNKGNWRQAEYELNNKKIKFYPPKGLVEVEKLVLRAIALKEHFSSKGFLVIEVHSGASYDILKMPRKNNYMEIKRLLKIYGLLVPRRDYSQVELDAIMAAFTGLLFLEAKVEFLGDEDEGQIVVPKVK